ncbi:TPA: DUF2089 domain-containing protein [Candidatus Poribacteria bacterium]|nr:DUF2089 domain-containing protein [Candidatus Poribacteria bacterium]
MRKIIEKCPGCGQNLIITRLRCPACETAIEGNYAPCPFCKLSEESLKFLFLFVRSRGNIKDMERELGVSYPTVRSRLNAIIEELEAL